MEPGLIPVRGRPGRPSSWLVTTVANSSRSQGELHFVVVGVHYNNVACRMNNYKAWSVKCLCVEHNEPKRRRPESIKSSAREHPPALEKIKTRVKHYMERKSISQLIAETKREVTIPKNGRALARWRWSKSQKKIEEPGVWGPPTCCLSGLNSDVVGDTREFKWHSTVHPSVPVCLLWYG